MLIVTFIQMTHINNMWIISMKEKVMYDEKQEVFKEVWSMLEGCLNRKIYEK